MSGAGGPPAPRSGGAEADVRIDPETWHAVYDSPAGRIFAETVDAATRLHGAVARPGELWVDVGCGTGRLSRRLAARPCRVIAVDRDEEMLAFARNLNRHPPPGASRSVEYVRADGNSLPLADRSVDGVAAVSLLGCLLRPERLLGEAARVLRRDGAAIFSFTNRWSLLRAWGKHVLSAAGRRVPAPPGCLPVRARSVRSAKKLARDVGLRVSGIYPYGFFTGAGEPRRDPASMPVEPRAPHAHRRGAARILLCRNFLLLARKPGG